MYPECAGAESALTADEFFKGKTKALKRISLEKGFIVPIAKDFVPPPTVIEEKARAPQNEKEVSCFLIVGKFNVCCVVSRCISCVKKGE